MASLKIIAVTLFFFMTTAIHAQSITAVFSNIDETQGLSSQGVNCLLQDRRGFLWIGTFNGLNCYDGKTFRIYRHSRYDSTSICDNDIRSLVEDENGSIWMGTKNGVSCLNPFSGKARNYVKNQSGPGVFTEAFLPIVFTSPMDQNVWVCGGGKIAHFDRRKSCFMTDERLSRFLKDAGRIHAINLDRENNFNIGTDHGFYVFNASQQHPTIPFLSKLTVISMETDGRGNHWLGTWSNGLVKLDKDGKSSTHMFTNPIFDASTENIVFDLQLEGDLLWLVTNNGLYKLDTRDTTFPSGLTKVVPYEKSTDSPALWSRLLLDQKNELWVGTNKGLYVVFKQSQQFTSYPVKGYVTDLLFDVEGAWGSSWYGIGLVRYDKKWRVLKNFHSIQAGATRSSYSQISEIAALDSIHLLTTTLNGLSIYNKVTNEITSLRHKAGDTNSIFENRLTAVLVTRSGEVWIGSYTSGISRCDKALRELHRYNVSNSVLTTNMIWKIFEDSRGKIWIGANNGIGVYDPLTDKMELKSTVRENNRTMRIGAITTVLEARNGDMWFCGDGVYCLKKNGKLLFYDVEDGLPTPEISGLAEDERGNIWMSSGNGLSCFLANEQKFRNYKSEDGLPVLELQNIFKNGNKLFAVATDLLLAFEPDKLNSPAKVPNTFLLSASFSDKQVSALELESERLKLNYSQNDLSVIFSSPLFQGQQNLSHQYKLEGADNRWSEGGVADVAHYPNLPSGDYVFHVRAFNRSQNQAGSEASFAFTIQPPFWASWWFRLLALCMVSAAIMGLIHIRKQRKIHLEAVRSRIARDLHDDVGSTLSSINILSEMAKVRLDADPRKTGKLISSIGENSRGMLERMDDIVWSIRPENDKLDNVLARMRSFASETLEAKSINCTFKSDPNLRTVQLPLEKRYDFFLVFKESVNNLAKYSQCTNAAINLVRSGNSIDLEVTDDGIGFDTSAKSEGDGLKNMRRRAQALRAEFYIESKPGMGTRVHLHVPLT